MKTYRAQTFPDKNDPHPTMMPGTLIAQQLTQLDAARSPEFDGLLFGDLILHHDGELEMVKTLFAKAGSGKGSENFRYALDGMADQRGEIENTQQMHTASAARQRR